MELKKKYPIGVQSFRDIIENDYIYVDKTHFVNPLIAAGKCVFLSRPRRFGKSLLLSMLECYFQGRKDLFEGLAISHEETEWRKYPVIHIDFSVQSYGKEDELKKFLIKKLYEIAKDYDISLLEDDSPSYLFEQLLKSVYKNTQQKVVVLIDEYDSAIIDAAHNEDLRQKNADVLRSFYKVLKAADQYLKFSFLTGVVRVELFSIFSGLNNLKDITMLPRFADICGITQQELEGNFQAGIAELGEALGLDHEGSVHALRRRYNGYRFTPKELTVCNPFSIIKALQDSQLKDYWVRSGTSKIFIDYLKQPDFFLPEITNDWVSETTLSKTFNSKDPVSLMFQTGYLTIADYDGEGNYQLRYPNDEVERGLLEELIPVYMHGGDYTKNPNLRLTKMRRYLNTGDVDSLMRELQGMIGSVPYDDWDRKRREKHFETMVYLIFMMIGVNARCQTHVSSGRIDMVAENDSYVYVFEYKLDGTARKALEQIDSKGYTLPWAAEDRQVIKVGVNFSSKTNTIADWISVTDKNG